MIASERLLTVILVCGFLSSKTSVDGSRLTCPRGAIVDLTKTKPLYGSVKKPALNFPKSTTWVEDGRTFGCPCLFKSCLQYCCPTGYALNESGCVKDEFSRFIVSLEQSTEDSYVFVDDPCHLTSTDHTSWGKYYNSSTKTRIWLNLKNRLGTFCLVRKENSFMYLIGVCDNPSYSSFVFWFVGCMSVSMLFTVVTFVVYSVTPELRNLEGSIFRCYLGSYISCVLLFTILVLLNNFLPSNLRYVIITGSGLYYFGVACMLWLNVMSFDIWQKFRQFGANRDVNMNKLNKAMLVRYSIYVWGGSVVPSSIVFTFPLWNPFKLSTETIVLYLAYVPIVCIGICSTCLFILTAFKIKQRKKETQHMVGGVNKQQKENEQWFNLYVKLFIIMGGPLIIWAIAFYWKNRIFDNFALLLEVLQAVSIFLIFVWKDDVKQAIRKRFVRVSRTLDLFLRREPTPNTEN